MRISAINYHSYSQKPTNNLKQNKISKQELSLQSNEINFKGTKWAIAEALTGAFLGFIAAGPVGAIVGAGVGAGVGSQLDDNESGIDEDSKPYNP